jgi:hypothetical protein
VAAVEEVGIVFVRKIDQVEFVSPRSFDDFSHDVDSYEAWCLNR